MYAKHWDIQIQSILVGKALFGYIHTKFQSPQDQVILVYIILGVFTQTCCILVDIVMHANASLGGKTFWSKSQFYVWRTLALRKNTARSCYTCTSSKDITKTSFWTVQLWPTMAGFVMCKIEDGSK